jgi:hypothetical protein
MRLAVLATVEHGLAPSTRLEGNAGRDLRDTAVDAGVGDKADWWAKLDDLLLGVSTTSRSCFTKQANCPLNSLFCFDFLLGLARLPR